MKRRSTIAAVAVIGVMTATIVPLEAPADTMKMEVAAVTAPVTTAGSPFTAVTFRQIYDEVPVVFTLATADGVDPAGLRIRNVTTTGFEIAIVEPGAEDGAHGEAMSTAYLAIEPGRIDFAGGVSIEAGRYSTTTAVNGTGSGNVGNPNFGSNVTAFDTVTFSGGTFGSTPAVLAELQTMNNETGSVPGAGPSSPWLTAAAKANSATSVDLALERAEVNDGTISSAEDIGYLAVMQGAGNLKDLTLSHVNVLYDALIGPDNIQGWDDNGNNGSNGNGDATSFVQTFTSNPLVIASMARRDGGDGGWLRRGTLSTTSVNFSTDEDQWSDAERGHTTEGASVLAFAAAFDTTLVRPLTPGVLIDWDARTEVGDGTASTWEAQTAPSTGNVLDIHQGPGGTAYPTLLKAGDAGFSSGRAGITAAFDFDGATQAMDTDHATTNSDNFDNLTGNPTDNTATWEVWFKPADLIGDEVILEAGGTTDGSGLYLSGDQLVFQVLDNGNQFAKTTTTLTSLDIADFMQVVGGIDLDNDRIYLYVNGVLTNPGGTPADDTTTTGVPGDGDIADWAGGDAASDGEGVGSKVGSNGGTVSGDPAYGLFDGQIAIIRLYDNKLLSADEVEANFDVASVPEPATLALLVLGGGILLARRRRR